MQHERVLFTNIAVTGKTGSWDLAVDDGIIASVNPASEERADAEASGASVIDAGGMIVFPSLTDAHLHLEKAFLLDRMDEDAATLADAIRLTAQLKARFTGDDIHARASRVLDREIAHGVGHVRCHVEIDDTLGMLAMETILALREEYASQIEVQIVAFPQEGIFTQRRGRELMVEALRLGADAVGGIPYNDLDPLEHLDFVFDLATAWGKPLDFHIDFSDDPAELNILPVIERTRSLGLAGRVSVGHLTSLGSVPRAEAEAIAQQLAEAGISVMTMPATDLYLNGRGDEQAQRRGLTPARMLLDAGVNVALATNNIQNPFTPFGRGNILDIARLFAETAQFGTARDAELVFGMLTTGPARATGMGRDGLRAGAPADLAVFPGRTARAVLNEADGPAYVYRSGRLLAERQLSHHPMSPVLKGRK